MGTPEIEITIRSFDHPSDLLGAPRIALSEVQVWHGSIELAPTDLRRAEQLLSADEKERAQRFHFDEHRNRYVAGRGILRTLTGAQLGIEPSALSFLYTEFGKPYLSAETVDIESERSHLQFNVSHSEGYAAFALTWNRRVGVDVERVRDDIKCLDLAERFFSRAENQALRDVPQDAIAAAFFRGWTRKEAYIKALGEGLSHPLDQFDVSLESNPKNALLTTRPDAEVAGHWQLRPFAARSGYAGAIAFEIAWSRTT